MALETRPLRTTLGKIGIFVAIAAAFLFGVTTTVYLSLRSREVQVPDVVGQHYLTGETTLEGAGLNIRKRAKRYKADAKPDTILDQSPRAGQVIKVGQTVAVVVSGGEAAEGEPAAPGAESEGAEGEGGSSEGANANANQNREQRDRNSNNKNSNNRNTRAANRNANSNRNANAANRNGSRNTNNRNVNANRNANAVRTNSNQSVPRTPTPR